MTARITLLDSISDPGNPAKPNDDSFGCNESCAFVIDGATGLGDRQYMDVAGSDAAWIAQHFARGFEDQITRESSISEVARGLSVAARAAFLRHNENVPRYAWPLTAFAMLHQTRDGFYFIGLGDSSVFLLQEDGSATMHMAIPGAYQYEQNQARKHIARTGGITKEGGALGNTETLASLRQHRERQNTPESGVWTLGLVPEAADHLISERLDVGRKAHAIVCSDGLSDLAVLYAAYDSAGLVRTARDKGLRPMLDELRHFEREIDPEGLRYPRYKQSDDTTALLVELTPDA
ncbi:MULTISPECIES: protein phosphatase 2C domain-containing protein [unclassified Rhizobium]|uniref:protein phosphatase 2C domain-containing protein n=1 Tax=unclassified Rhizobium TaxID=2613769 RepID=UPI00161C5608|nr:MULTISPECIES: protein phosphatase 2C domain-containing protein [unclassified Rhizobium]